MSKILHLAVQEHRKGKKKHGAGSWYHRFSFPLCLFCEKFWDFDSLNQKEMEALLIQNIIAKELCGFCFDSIEERRCILGKFTTVEKKSYWLRADHCMRWEGCILTQQKQVHLGNKTEVQKLKPSLRKLNLLWQVRPPWRPEYPAQVGVGCDKLASSCTQNFLFGPWVYYLRCITLLLNGRYYGVCLPLLSDSSSALSASCTLVFGDVGCAPEAAQSSQSVDRCVLGIPDQIPGLCCYFGSPAMTMHLGLWSNNRAILTRSWESCTLLTVKSGFLLQRALVLPQIWATASLAEALFWITQQFPLSEGFFWLTTGWCRGKPQDSLFLILPPRLIFVFYWPQKPYKQIWFLSASHTYVYWSWAWLLPKGMYLQVALICWVVTNLEVHFVCCTLALITGVSERNILESSCQSERTSFH